ncbi:MAG: hypothetical protein RIQ33_1809 [Bacteroidota bacterium]
MKIQIQTNINAFQIFQVLRFGAYLLISILLVKAGFSTENIGVYEYLLMLGGSASFFWLGGFLTFYISKSDEKTSTNQYYQTTFNVLFIFNCLFAATLFVGFYFFKNAWFNSIPSSTFLLFIIFHFANNQAYINEHYLLVNNENKKLIHYGILNFLSLLFGAGLGFYYYQSLNGILLALSIVALLKMCLSIYFYLKSPNSIFIKSKKIQSFATQGLIISFSILIGSLGDYMDEYLVHHFYGNETYAIYKMGAREFPLLQLLTNSLATILIVIISKNELAEALQQFKKKTASLIKVLVPILCLLIIASKFLFPLFYNQQFSNSAIYFNLYTLLVFSRFLFPQSIIIGLGMNKYLMIGALAECTLHIVLSLLLMQFWGIYGIIAGFLISYLADKFLLMYFLYLHKKIMPFDYLPIKDYLIGNLLVTITVIAALAL